MEGHPISPLPAPIGTTTGAQGCCVAKLDSSRPSRPLRIARMRADDSARARAPGCGDLARLCLLLLRWIADAWPEVERLVLQFLDQSDLHWPPPCACEVRRHEHGCDPGGRPPGRA